MILLGIESSCDETGIAIVKGGRVLVDLVSSQVAVHKNYGGVVPEFASRMQIEDIGLLTQQACIDTGIKLSQIDGIAVTIGPGLIGSVLVGVNFAKGLAYALDKPLIGVDHVQAHLFSPLIEFNKLTFPYIGLVVSGGHTELYTVRSVTDTTLNGKTIDDAAGEAFDKISTALGLGYPGGPEIDRIVKESKNIKRIKFPMALMTKGNYSFSFSGLKTAVIRYIKQHASDMNYDMVCSIAAGFQDAVVTVLIKKAVSLARYKGIKRIALSGGVTANSRLRKMFEEFRHEFDIYIPSAKICTDNGSMIASLGYRLLKLGIKSSIDIEAYANNTHIPKKIRASAS